MKAPLADTISALTFISYPAGTRAKKFVADIQHVDPSTLSPPQCQYVYALAWRFRRQMPAHLVPSPPDDRKTGTWRPAVPRRIVVRSKAACPAWAVWVGEGSRWENPWASKRLEISGAIVRIFRVLFNPPPVFAFRRGTIPRPPTASERATVQAFAFDRWLLGWDGYSEELLSIAEDVMRPKNLLEMTEAAAEDVVPFPAPWDHQLIREHLAGKSLATSIKLDLSSHADTLLRIANGAPQP